MSSPPEICLRPLTVDDVSEEYVRWIKDPEVNKFLDIHDVTLEEQRQYVARKITQDNCRFLGIFVSNSQKMIGTVKLEPIDWQRKITNFGIMIGDRDYLGKGAGSEATRQALAYAFDELGLETVELSFIKGNERAQRAFAKAGFTDLKEGEREYEGKMQKIVYMKAHKK